MTDKYVSVPVDFCRKLIAAIRETNNELFELTGERYPDFESSVDGLEKMIDSAPEPASSEPVAASINDISNDAAELNRLKCALQDEKVACGVMLAFWRRVFGSANMSLFDKQSMTAHMLTALSGVEVFSRNKLADVECPDCGPVSVTPDVYNAGIPIGGECPYCQDRLYFYQQPQPPEVE